MEQAVGILICVTFVSVVVQCPTQWLFVLCQNTTAIHTINNNCNNSYKAKIFLMVSRVGSLFWAIGIFENPVT